MKKEAHPRSRKAEQMNRKAGHEKRKVESKIKKQKKKKPKLERFKWFFEKIKNEKKIKLTKEEVKEMIQEYLKDKKEEENHTFLDSIQQEAEEKEISSNQLELPDFTDEQNMKLFMMWDKSSDLFEQIKFKKF
jgi:hypothetical protein